MKKILLLLCALAIGPSVVQAQTLTVLCGSGTSCAYVATDRIGEETWNKVRLNFDTLNAIIKTGTGSPEGVVTANIASIYRQTNGADGTALWMKISGTGNTGWRQFLSTSSVQTVSGKTMTGPSGSASSPTYSFSSDTNSGIYSVGADDVGLSTGGTVRFDIDTARILATLPFRTADGSSAAPTYSFSSDTDNGMYLVAANDLGFSVSGTKRVDINTSRIQFALPLEPTTNLTQALGSNSVKWGDSYLKRVIIGDEASQINNVMLRHADGTDPNFLVTLAKGDESALGNLYLGHFAAGADSDPTFSAAEGLIGQVNEVYSGADFATGANFFKVAGQLNPSANITRSITASYGELDPGGSHNYSGADMVGVYGSNYPAGSGNFTGETAGLLGDAEHGSSGTANQVFAVVGAYCCSFGTNGAIARGGMFHGRQPFQGSTATTHHDGLWLEDQTAGGTYTASTNHALHIEAQTGSPLIMSAVNGEVSTTSVQLAPNGVSRPACGSGTRGTFWYTPGAGGVADLTEACKKDSSDVYAWTSTAGTGGSGDVSGPGSSTDNAIVRWNLTSGTGIQNSNVTIDDTGVFAFPDGVRQTFNPDGTNAGINVGSQAGDPSSLTNGDIWYNSSVPQLYARINGVTTALGSAASNYQTITSQLRVTLTTATPFLSSSVTAATTVYCTPAVGNLVPIYDGTGFTATEVSELSQATTDNTKSPAAATTNSNYDIFVWNDGGTKRCTRGPAWSSDTSRGTGAGTTELEFVKGTLLNKVSITNGPAADRGTYIGTIRTNGSSQVDMVFGGAGAAGGENTILGIWNMYNQKPVSLTNFDNTDSWNYTTASYRIKDNNNANKISFVIGWQGVGLSAQNYINASNTSANVGMETAIALNSTTVAATGSAMGRTASLVTTALFGASAGYTAMAPLGFNYIAPLEASSATGTTTWYGDNGASALLGVSTFQMTTVF